jgi:hypothetical protein
LRVRRIHCKIATNTLFFFKKNKMRFGIAFFFIVALSVRFVKSATTSIYAYDAMEYSSQVAEEFLWRTSETGGILNASILTKAHAVRSELKLTNFVFVPDFETKVAPTYCGFIAESVGVELNVKKTGCAQFASTIQTEDVKISWFDKNAATLRVVSLPFIFSVGANNSRLFPESVHAVQRFGEFDKLEDGMQGDASTQLLLAISEGAPNLQILVTVNITGGVAENAPVSCGAAVMHAVLVVSAKNSSRCIGEFVAGLPKNPFSTTSAATTTTPPTTTTTTTTTTTPPPTTKTTTTTTTVSFVSNSIESSSVTSSNLGESWIPTKIIESGDNTTDFNNTEIDASPTLNTHVGIIISNEDKARIDIEFRVYLFLCALFIVFICILGIVIARKVSASRRLDPLASANASARATEIILMQYDQSVQALESFTSAAQEDAFGSSVNVDNSFFDVLRSSSDEEANYTEAQLKKGVKYNRGPRPAAENKIHIH